MSIDLAIAWTDSIAMRTKRPSSAPLWIAAAVVSVIALISAAWFSMLLNDRRNADLAVKEFGKQMDRSIEAIASIGDGDGVIVDGQARETAIQQAKKTLSRYGIGNLEKIEVRRAVTKWTVSGYARDTNSRGPFALRYETDEDGKARLWKIISVEFCGEKRY